MSKRIDPEALAGVADAIAELAKAMKGEELKPWAKTVNAVAAAFMAVPRVLLPARLGHPALQGVAGLAMLISQCFGKKPPERGWGNVADGVADGAKKFAEFLRTVKEGPKEGAPIN